MTRLKITSELSELSDTIVNNVKSVYQNYGYHITNNQHYDSIATGWYESSVEWRHTSHTPTLNLNVGSLLSTNNSNRQYFISISIWSLSRPNPIFIEMLMRKHIPQFSNHIESGVISELDIQSLISIAQQMTEFLFAQCKHYLTDTDWTDEAFQRKD